MTCAFCPFLSALLLALTACGGSNITGASTVLTVPGDNRSRTVMVPVGDELDIVLGNVGPGTFELATDFSSPAVQYLGVSVVPPFTPAGPTQQFRFLARAPGTAVLHFNRMLEYAATVSIEDTVVVF